MDVIDHLLEMVVVADISVKVFHHPQFSFAIKRFIDGMCGIGFPIVHNLRQRHSFYWRNQRVDMIGHNAPTYQLVFLLMIKKKGILNDLSYAIITQQAFTYASIFVLINEFEETVDFLLVGFEG